jgi:hypothetical protein
MRLAHFHPLIREIRLFPDPLERLSNQERFTHVLRVIDQIEANLRILFSEEQWLECQCRDALPHEEAWRSVVGMRSRASGVARLETVATHLSLVPPF